MQNHLRKPIIFAFSGRSNSGKTTLICRLCEYLHSFKIAVIKHDPKDKAVLDTKGKDSYEFFQRTGAVALISPTRTVLQYTHSHFIESSAFAKAASIESNAADSINDIQNVDSIESTKNAFYAALAHFKDYDYIFIEGLKTLPFPRIVVARDVIESAYIPYANAFAIDESVRNMNAIPAHLPRLQLNNIPQIADFIRDFAYLPTDSINAIKN